MSNFPNVRTGQLNVTNPKYAAKYGNPYLRESSPMFDQTMPLQTTPEAPATPAKLSGIDTKQQSPYPNLDSHVPSFAPQLYHPQHIRPYEDLGHHPLGGPVQGQHALDGVVHAQHPVGGVVPGQHPLGGLVPGQHSVVGLVPGQHSVGGVVPAHYIQTQDGHQNSRLATHV